MGCQRVRPSPKLRRRPREMEDLAMERARTRVDVPVDFSSRAAADAQHISQRIVQNTPCPNFYIAYV
jgi:hypothetical protein